MAQGLRNNRPKVEKLKLYPCASKDMVIVFSPFIFLWQAFTLLKDDKMPFYRIAFSARGLACKAIKPFYCNRLENNKRNTYRIKSQGNCYFYLFYFSKVKLNFSCMY